MRSDKPRKLSRVEIGTLAASILAIGFGIAYAGTQPHMFGTLFGLAQDQTVRVNLVSVDNPDFRGAALPPNPCMAQLKIFAGDGSVVVESKVQKVMPGASLSFDLKYSDLLRADSPKVTSFAAIDSTARAQLRVATYLVSPDDHKAAACPSDYKYLKLSVEVFDDATGRTTFMVPTDSFLPAVQ